MNALLHDRLGSIFPPMGFDAGDANLYRFVDNDPTNATDPTGLYLVTKDKQALNAFLNRDLKALGEKNIKTLQLKSGLTYIDTTPGNYKGLFEYADLRWFRVFSKDMYRDYITKKDNTWKKEVDARDAFLFASGVVGDGLARKKSFELTNGMFVDLAPVTLTADDLKEIQEFNSKNNKSYPLVVDLGGEGRFTQMNGAPVINGNIRPFDSSNDMKPIPNFIYADGTNLPFLANSVSYMYVEGVPIDEKWVSQIVNVMQKGGKVKLYFPVGRINAALKLFQDVKAASEWTRLGDYLKLGEDVGAGFEVTINKKGD